MSSPNNKQYIQAQDGVEFPIEALPLTVDKSDCVYDKHLKHKQLIVVTMPSSISIESLHGQTLVMDENNKGKIGDGNLIVAQQDKELAKQCGIVTTSKKGARLVKINNSYRLQLSDNEFNKRRMEKLKGSLSSSSSSRTSTVISSNNNISTSPTASRAILPSTTELDTYLHHPFQNNSNQDISRLKQQESTHSGSNNILDESTDRHRKKKKKKHHDKNSTVMDESNTSFPALLSDDNDQQKKSSKKKKLKLLNE
jgi:hypothetical protein